MGGALGQDDGGDDICFDKVQCAERARRELERLIGQPLDAIPTTPLARDDWFTGRAGRQRTRFGGERLVGWVNWTQQGRTFDGVRLVAMASDDDDLGVRRKRDDLTQRSEPLLDPALVGLGVAHLADLDSGENSEATAVQIEATCKVSGKTDDRGRVLLERKGCVNCHTTGKRSAVGLLVAPRMDVFEDGSMAYSWRPPSCASFVDPDPSARRFFSKSAI